MSTCHLLLRLFMRLYLASIKQQRKLNTCSPCFPCGQNACSNPNSRQWNITRLLFFWWRRGRSLVPPACPSCSLELHVGLSIVISSMLFLQCRSRQPGTCLSQNSCHQSFSLGSDLSWEFKNRQETEAVLLILWQQWADTWNSAEKRFFAVVSGHFLQNHLCWCWAVQSCSVFF